MDCGCIILLFVTGVGLLFILVGVVMLGSTSQGWIAIGIGAGILIIEFLIFSAICNADSKRRSRIMDSMRPR